MGQSSAILAEHERSQYVLAAIRYAERVVSGEEIACKWVKLACERFLEDLNRAKSKRFVYELDEAVAHKFCWAVEHLPHVKGEWARRREHLKLEDFQALIIVNVFGWVHKKTRLRRFRTVYIDMARKNAKSTLAAAMLLLMLALDNEAGAECYSAATTRDQAKIVWGIARQMALSESKFREDLHIKVGAHALTGRGDSKCEPLSSEADSLEGKSPSCAVVDELHAHSTREVVDVLETATSSRAQPLIIYITTAGIDRAGICFEKRSYTCKLLEGIFRDETWWGIIFTLDDGDEWQDRSVWKKANPNLNVSVYEDDLERKCRQAEQTPSLVNNFLVKHMNVWVSADSSWMDMRAWNRCADESLRIEDYAGRPALVAFDLATKRDVVARASLFAEEDGTLVAFVRFYLPEVAVESSPNSQYVGWARQDFVHVTEGDVVDFNVIEDELLELATQVTIMEIPFDPFQATQFSQRMTERGLPMVQVGATVKNFSEPMKQLEAIVLSGKFKHDGNPMLAWMVSNVVCHYDKKDNVYPNKETEHNKIDGVIAILMALRRHLDAPDWVGGGRSIYETRELRMVE